MEQKQKECKHKRWKTSKKKDGERLYVKCRKCGIVKSVKSNEYIEPVETIDAVV